MKNFLLLGLFLLVTGRANALQVSGSAGGFGASGGTASEFSESLTNLAARSESQKRRPTAAELKDDGTSTFIDASVLMNVKADEYVAVFALREEGATPAEAAAKMDATVAEFQNALRSLGVREADSFVDFVSQSRIYAFQLEKKTAEDGRVETVAREELAGFELKKNVSVRFSDAALVDRLVAAAARSEIYDLVKVDYVVKDAAKIQAALQAQTMAILRQKAARYETQLGVKLSEPTQVLVDALSIYYPVQQYASYVAAEAEKLNLPYDRSRYSVLNARKSRSTFFNPLSADGFDTVINPIVLEPVVQFTTYLKVKFEPQNKRRK